MKAPSVLMVTRYGHPLDTGGVANAMRNVLINSVNNGVSFHVASIRPEYVIDSGCLESANYDNLPIDLDIFTSPEGFTIYKNPDFEGDTNNLVSNILDSVKDKKFDLVHVVTGYPNYATVGRKIASELNVPYFISVRGADVYGHNPELEYDSDREWYLDSWKGAKCITALSDFQIGNVVKNLEFMNSDVDVVKIRNGVDTEKFKPLGQVEIPSGKIKLAYTGRIRKFKGIVSMMESVQKAREMGVDIEFDIRGPVSGEWISALHEVKSHIKKNKLEDIVYLHEGYVPNGDLPQVYRNHNLFIHASTGGEGHANAIMEAMSCGLPVMLNYPSGCSDMLENGEFVFETGDIERMGEIMDNVSRNPEKLVKEGKRNREFALEHNWKVISRQYCDLYRDVI